MGNHIETAKFSSSLKSGMVAFLLVSYNKSTKEVHFLPSATCTMADAVLLAAATVLLVACHTQTSSGFTCSLPDL